MLKSSLVLATTSSTRFFVQNKQTNKQTKTSPPLNSSLVSATIGSSKGSSINYIIADRGGGVSPKDYSRVVLKPPV